MWNFFLSPISIELALSHVKHFSLKMSLFLYSNASWDCQMHHLWSVSACIICFSGCGWVHCLGWMWHCLTTPVTFSSEPDFPILAKCKPSFLIIHVAASSSEYKCRLWTWSCHKWIVFLISSPVLFSFLHGLTVQDHVVHVCAEIKDPVLAVWAEGYEDWRSYHCKFLYQASW